MLIGYFLDTVCEVFAKNIEKMLKKDIIYLKYL